MNIFRLITDKKEKARTIQDYIGSNMQIVYTPPEPGSILIEKLTNWFDIAVNNKKLGHLLIMAILHYQFKAILLLATAMEAQEEF